MKKFTMRHFTLIGVIFYLFPILMLSVGCQKHLDQQSLREFRQVNLVANNSEYDAPHIDPALINAWGLAFSPNGIAWISAQGGHVSTIYDRLGNTLRPPVNIPSPGGETGGNPTGIVFNNTDGFFLSNKGKASFLFVGVDGILSGWNGAAANNALVIKNNSTTSAYTGLAIDSSGNDKFLYAADFRAGKIAVWNSTFTPVSMSFTDPALPAGYSPFNIQNIENRLYVSYAKVGANGRDEAGVGNGFVSIFNPDGSFVKRFASGGLLNAPWGLVKAPATFFADTDDSGLEDVVENGNGNHNQPAILVGNFGDGRINAYNLDGRFLGQLKEENKVITIEGLWALSFAPATATMVNPNWLYFTAGPDEEQHGVFGYIVKE